MTTPVKDLVTQAQQGNLSAFEELVSIYQDRVYSHCYHLAANQDDAEDLAQDVFVQAFKGINTFRHDADFSTWLHRIAVNLWINFYRRSKKIVSFSIDEPVVTHEGEIRRELAAHGDDPLDKIEQLEFNSIVHGALNRILPEYRVALVLRDIEGYNYDEIADMLNCSLGTVKSRINRGRKALKIELEAKLGK